jgi:superoxide dismutase, Cu-Zn family
MKALLTIGLPVGFLLLNQRISDSKNIKSIECDVMKSARKAICILNPDGDSKAKGIVEIGQIQANKPVHIRGTFSGLSSNGKHGFHIHQWGNLTKGCSTAGPHFNPYTKSHGGPNDEERHLGDLGNINSDEEGRASFELIDSKISLYGCNSIIGRSLVVHKDEDDLGRGNFEDSKTTGHSGARIACGVIGLTEFTTNDMRNYLF